MTDHEGENKRIENLAEDVLDISRNRLLVNLRYMDTALTFHKREPFEGTIATDGKRLLYDPVFILKMYSGSKAGLIRAYLHVVMHCIFMHPFKHFQSDGSVDGLSRRFWDLACDIAVESTVNELDIPSTRVEKTPAQIDMSKKIRRETGFLTAEKIYSALRKDSLSMVKTEADLMRLEELFRADDHVLWYDHLPAENIIDDAAPLILSDDASSGWKKMAEKIEMELETFAKVKGRYASSLVQNLRAVNREHYDYEDFLRKFSAVNETVRVSDEEFDYIYYNYGLQNYRNMPLIEPLEYREDSRIRDFVIAVDTSGSVAGEAVREFIQKTYNILKTREAFDSRINVHIIQCDAKVQSDTVITCKEDIDRYLTDMKILGLGGTDFRPVFDYVDKLLKEGGFSDLKGLIYFTDGLGTYPVSKPAYKTAFVFVESGYNVPEVPVWAMKVVLQPNEM